VCVCVCVCVCVIYKRQQRGGPSPSRPYATQNKKQSRQFIRHWSAWLAFHSFFLK